MSINIFTVIRYCIQLLMPPNIPNQPLDLEDRTKRLTNALLYNYFTLQDDFIVGPETLTDASIPDFTVYRLIDPKTPRAALLDFLFAECKRDTTNATWLDNISHVRRSAKGAQDVDITNYVPSYFAICAARDQLIFFIFQKGWHIKHGYFKDEKYEGMIGLKFENGRITVIPPTLYSGPDYFIYQLSNPNQFHEIHTIFMYMSSQFKPPDVIFDQGYVYLLFYKSQY